MKWYVKSIQFSLPTIKIYGYCRRLKPLFSSDLFYSVDILHSISLHFHSTFTQKNISSKYFHFSYLPHSIFYIRSVSEHVNRNEDPFGLKKNTLNIKSLLQKFVFKFMEKDGSCFKIFKWPFFNQHSFKYWLCGRWENVAL